MNTVPKHQKLIVESITFFLCPDYSLSPQNVTSPLYRKVAVRVMQVVSFLAATWGAI